VTHDPQRPFVVDVGPDTRVTALGTRFQVRTEDKGAAVTLLEGSVRVERGRESRVLEVGEQALLAAAGGIDVHAVDLEETTSWSRGWMVFRGQSLRYVVDEVNRYAERKIRIADPALTGLQLSGNFYLGDSASMVAAMSVVLPLAVERDGKTYVLHPAAAAVRIPATSRIFP
jgi:transmembrane sensor